LSVFEITDWQPKISYFLSTLRTCFFRSFFGKKRYDILLLEYGIDTPGEMDFILKVAHPDVGVFTAIDAVHSEQFGSPADIANEEIKMALHTKQLVFLNADDTYAMQLLPRIQVDKLTYQTKGHQSKADLTFSECNFLLGEAKHEIQSVFSLNLKGKTYHITTNLIGKANYGYIAVALTIAETLHFQMNQTNLISSFRAKAKLASQSEESLHKDSLHLLYTLQPGRLSIFAGKHDSILFDSTYNASPRSVREIIDTVFTIRSQLFPSSEIWLILGDMRELGTLTETEHRSLAGYVSQVADKVFLLGTSTHSYLADELDKINFDKTKLLLANSLKNLNNQIETALKKAETPFPLLIFKGSQNTIFLEESVKHFLLHSTDEKFLTRQSTFWTEKKKTFLKT
jgi:UDP-N-acetylmuramoyl-tripeptide--D-alanyl-D-alanine ligase